MRHFEIEKKKRERNNNSLSHTIQIQTVKKINNNSFIHRNQFALIVEERR
jgi:hypothetical protein